MIVKIISSPYSDVKNGTIAEVEQVLRNHFDYSMPGRHPLRYDCYKLKNLPHQYFGAWEVEVIKE